MPRKLSPLPTQRRLHELLAYCQETGEFVWRVSSGTAAAGTVAGSVHRSGYRYIGIDGRGYKAHRLAWVYVFGDEPVGLLDHIDRNPSNNAIANLRPATHAENQQNKRVYKNNRVGFKGVSWWKQQQRWRVRLQTDGHNRVVGYYETLLDAVAARIRAERAAHSHRAKFY